MDHRLGNAFPPASPRTRCGHSWLLPTILAFLSLSLRAPAAPDEPAPFGFTGPEIFPIDYGIAFLRAADLNGDGLQDLVVANNARSKISLLLNQTGHETEDPPTASSYDLNELPPDARFKLTAIASEKRISALIVADLNHDQQPDLAYYGEPKELVVQYNQGTNGWSTPKRWPLSDGQLTPNALAACDVDGDDRVDLLLLGDRHIHLLRQNKDGELTGPERIPYAGENKSVQALDINGDQRNDLLLVNWDHPNPFRFRLQLEGGTLGPEYHFPLPPIRSYWADDLDGDGKTEVVTITMQSGRSQIWNFQQKQANPIADGLPAGQFQILPLPATSQAKRGLAWADLNRDGHSDLLVSEPDSGQLALHLQQADGSLPVTKTFPSLAGISDIAVRLDPSLAEPEIFLLSGEERQVGLTRLTQEGRIPFPSPLPIRGKPLALGLGPLQAEAESSLAVIVDDNGRRKIWLRSPSGEFSQVELNADFRGNPSTVAFHDADQDGLTDLVLLIPYEKIKVLRQTENHTFEELDVDPPGGALERPWLARADVDDDQHLELLLGQKNFVRAVVLSSKKEPDSDRSTWTFRVVDQINGATSRSRIIAAAPLSQPNSKVPWLCLLDAELKQLSLCQRDAMGVWQIQHNLELPYADYLALEQIQIGDSSQPSMACLGLNALGWIHFSGQSWILNALDSYETPIRDARLYDVVSGDLNQDQRKDLVFLETARNYLDVVLFEPEGQLRSVLHWPVFEQRSFRGRRASDQTEPREALIADLTGDGRNDLAVVVHDRILVYPQE